MPSERETRMRSLRGFTARFETVGRRVGLVEPELIQDRELRFLPPPARLIERWNGVSEILRMRIA